MRRSTLRIKCILYTLETTLYLWNSNQSSFGSYKDRLHSYLNSQTTIVVSKWISFFFKKLTFFEENNTVCIVILNRNGIPFWKYSTPKLTIHASSSYIFAKGKLNFRLDYSARKIERSARAFVLKNSRIVKDFHVKKIANALHICKVTESQFFYLLACMNKKKIDEDDIFFC